MLGKEDLGNGDTLELGVELAQRFDHLDRLEDSVAGRGDVLSRWERLVDQAETGGKVAEDLEVEVERPNSSRPT